MNNQKTVGLALGSGGARGLAHIGVIKALLENNITIDCIAGTSAGALIGGLYSVLGIDKLSQLTDELNYTELLSAFSDPFSSTGLFKGQKVIEFLKRHIGDLRIEDLPIKFAAVATNISTGKAQVIDNGDLCTAIRASSSIPVVFEPVQIGSNYFVDGGISMPVPVEVVKEMGADIVIGVNVYPSANLSSDTKKPGMIDVAKTSVGLLLYHLSKENLKGADIAIDIDTITLGTFDFLQGEAVINEGSIKTNSILEEQRQLLG